MQKSSIKNRIKKGFTMAEMLLTIAILMVLMAIAFVGVINYLRSMAQLECDGIAKEIFVAAQNHLTMAEEQGYLGKSVYGTLETAAATGGGAGGGSGDDGTGAGGGDDGSGTGGSGSTAGGSDAEIRYFIVNRGDAFTADNSSVLDLMLPFGSVDETVRLGGSYIVRYQVEPALVLDVFYCRLNGRFRHALASGDYADCLALRDTEGVSHRRDRRTFGSDRSVLGWYGGAEALALQKGEVLKQPSLTVINAERLIAKVTNPNKDVTNASLVLIITGKTSGKKVQIPLTPQNATTTANVSYDAAASEYTIILDDITTEGLHFTELFEELYPGEDLSVQAVAYNNSELSNIAYSAEKTTNSLFADPDGATPVSGKDASVRIGNIRHLENLHPEVRNTSYSYESEKLHIVSAQQITDLDWDEFLTAIGDDEASVLYAGGDTGSAGGKFLPVELDYPISYDGQRHSISNVKVETADNAGLFGTLPDGSRCENLMLQDFDIVSTGGSAGSLAGAIQGAALTNVVSMGSSASVKGAKDTGGLVGQVMSGTLGTSIEACAASVLVESTGDDGGNAGGLIGSTTPSAGSSSSVSILDSYAGGHTSEGLYTNTYNVTSSSGSAGGLVGMASGKVSVTSSYATASASGIFAGGLAGSASSTASFGNSYAAGRVSGSSTEGALFGSFSGTVEDDCWFFEIVNERKNPTTGAFTYLGAGTDSAKVSALDATLASYKTFVGDDRESALAYDPTLIRNYQGEYSLKTIGQLDDSLDEDYYVNIHFGDWPSPEILFENAAG